LLPRVWYKTISRLSLFFLPWCIRGDRCCQQRHGTRQRRPAAAAHLREVPPSSALRRTKEAALVDLWRPSSPGGCTGGLVEVAIAGEASRSSSMQKWGRSERVGREGSGGGGERGTVSQQNTNGLVDVNGLQKVGLAAVAEDQRPKACEFLVLALCSFVLNFWSFCLSLMKNNLFYLLSGDPKLSIATSRRRTSLWITTTRQR
jgi:hypothetical protein